MQRITKLKDEALKKAPVGGGPAKNAERTSRRAIQSADKKGRGLWSTITSAVSDAFAGVTGRKQAERKRKKAAAAGAAGAATLAGAAGVLLAKRKSRDAEAEREAAFQAPQPVPGPTGANGAAAEPVPQQRRTLRLSQEVTTSIEIDAPASVVWSVLMDPSRLGDWVSAHRDVDWEGGELAEGDTFKQTLRLGGAKTKIEWTVDELDEPTRAVWSGRGPARSQASVVYSLAEKRGRTMFDYTNSFELPGGPVGRLAGRVASAAKGKAEAEKSLNALKKLLES